MEYKVTGRQFNSKDCLVCGVENTYSLNARFYELENGELVATFSVLNGHQSYPHRLHGGISSAILDETIGRAVMINEPNTWGVTVELNVKYKKPLPLDQSLFCTGRITRNTSRIFEGTGEILLPDGTVAVSAYGKYMKLPVDKITHDPHSQNGSEFKVFVNEPIPEFISF